MTTVATTAAALVAGLATSLHCAGMCGPIACGLGTLARSEGERLGAASLYHGTRLLSYTVIGAICGAVGQQPLRWFFDSPAVVLPWAMVGFLLLMATGWEKKIPRPAFLLRWTARLKLRAGRAGVFGSSAVVGLLTPLLPCGPLYALFLAALLTGSAARGAEFMMAFGLGTVPLLWMTQHGFQRLRTRLGPRGVARVQRGLALLTALVLAWRLHGTVPFASAAPAPTKATELPSCCH